MSKDEVHEALGSFCGILKLYDYWLANRLPDLTFSHYVAAEEFDRKENGCLDGFSYEIKPDGSGMAHVRVTFKDDGFIHLAEEYDELSTDELLAIDAACEAQAGLLRLAH